MLQVSVIVPTYNRAGYLAEALQSVFDQSLPPHEVIVVDDGSRDHTAPMVQALGARVRYLWQENKGVSAARNRGLSAAQGDIIAWLDADDLWEPDFLAQTVPLLETTPELDGVYSGLRYIDATGNRLPQVSRKVVASQDLFATLSEDCFIQTSTLVMRKRCFEKVGPFDEQFRICEDYDMWLRLARLFTIVGVPLPLVRYRIHGANTISNKKALCDSRLAVIQKHFGPPEGRPDQWPFEKRRAYAYAYRFIGITYLPESPAERGWHYVERAAETWPEILAQLGTYYELICHDQPMGHRGEANALDIENKGTEVLRWLGGLFAKTGQVPDALRRTAYGNAYLALGMLSDQAGRWDLARHFLLQATKTQPGLLGSHAMIRRLLKVYAGQRMVGMVRRVVGGKQRMAPHTETAV